MSAVTDEPPFSSEGDAAGFGPPRVAGGRLVFVYRDRTARRVRVSGEFNGWNPALGQFSRAPDGTWRLDIPAPEPGRYRYKFLIDETRWIADPSHEARDPDPFGGFDSVLVVQEAEAGEPAEPEAGH